MKVFIGLREVSGHNLNLEKGFRRIGVACDFINIYPHPYQYNSKDDAGFPVRLAVWINRRFLSFTKRNPIKKIFWGISLEIVKFILFLRCLLAYDVFIFVYGSTFLHYWDYPILKFFGKKLICAFQGSDSRPPYVDGYAADPQDELEVQRLIALTKKVKHRVRMADRYADIIVSYPPMAYFLERPFILGLAIGIPTEPAEIKKTKDQSNEGAIRIFHAPSHVESKGTLEISRAIEALKSKGHRIKFITRTGVANCVILEELVKCDFVVDQLYSDTPMAAFAAEAAYFGKPSVVCGYYAEYIAEDIPAELIPPSLFCVPEKIQESIEKMILNPEYRIALGRKAQDFVKANKSPQSVAGRYLQLVQGVFPESWLYSPQQIRYLYGAGLSKKRVIERVKKMVRSGGKSALQLDDKPELERCFLELSEHNE